MAVRPLTERVEEVKQKRDKAQKKLAQYDEQIKRMEKQAIEEERKARTHKLIVCGAELASLFGKVLELDEVYKVVNYLRAQRDLGLFTLEEKETLNTEKPGDGNEKTENQETVLYGGFFNF